MMLAAGCGRLAGPVPPQPTRGDPLRQVADADGGPPPRLEVDHWDADGERHAGLFAGGRAISLDAFLHLTGRTDVLDRMRTRRQVRLGVAAAGVAIIAGAALAMGLGESCDGVEDDPRTPAHEPAACLDRRNFRGSVTGAIGLGGAGLIVVAYHMSPLAPSRDELRRAAARYNDQHRVTGAAAVSELELAPAVSPDAATLTVSGRF